jgi:hypothetical protein
MGPNASVLIDTRALMGYRIAESSGARDSVAGAQPIQTLPRLDTGSASGVLLVREFFGIE